MQRVRLCDSDPTTLRDDVVARLRRGALCALPTETVYGLTVLPSNAAAVAAARRLKGRDGDQPFTWHLADRAGLQRLGALVTPGVERLIARYWPGPLTLLLAGADGGTIGARLPAHAFTRAVIAAAGEPLWMTSVNRGGEAPEVTPDGIARVFADEVDLLVDDGPSPLGTASTIVRATGDELEVLREGILSRDEVFATAAELVVFVCTGNTCRSPLAEAFARRLTAVAMGTTDERVLPRGLGFASAGISTMPGMPASEGSLVAGAEVGLDLTPHLSQQLSPELWRRASRIYCLGDSHRRALLAEAPEVADRVHLLRADGLDIADPYGGDLRAYRRARDEIRAAVAARLPEWLPAKT